MCYSVYDHDRDYDYEYDRDRDDDHDHDRDHDHVLVNDVYLLTLQNVLFSLFILISYHDQA